MRIVLYYHSVMPVSKYGGSQRVVMWLGRGLAELGHHVYLMSFPGSRADCAECIWVSNQRDLVRKLPADAEVVHLRSNPESEFPRPVLVTIGGNYSDGRRFHPDTVFLSRSHARRHHARRFVYNGLDPADYEFRPAPAGYLLFLSKVRWKVKGVHWALEVARRTGLPLIVAGGWRPSLRRNVRFVGMVGDERKRELLAGARALIFPTLWPEPFGNVVTEALAAGTPVITTNNGAMPELVTEEVGFRCDSVEEMVAAVGRLDEIDPRACRRRVEEHFNHRRLAADYLELYRLLLERGTILEPGEEPPRAPADGPRW